MIFFPLGTHSDHADTQTACSYRWGPNTKQVAVCDRRAVKIIVDDVLYVQPQLLVNHEIRFLASV